MSGMFRQTGFNALARVPPFLCFFLQRKMRNRSFFGEGWSRLLGTSLSRYLYPPPFQKGSGNYFAWIIFFVAESVAVSSL